MDVLLYLANGLNLLSYFMRDVLYLRIFTILSVTCLALYFASRTEPLMEVVYWNLFFLLLNGFQIGRILLERRRLARGTPGRQADEAAA